MARQQHKSTKTIKQATKEPEKPETKASRIQKTTAEVITAYKRRQTWPYCDEALSELNNCYLALCRLAAQVDLPRPPTAKITGPEAWLHEIEVWLVEALGKLEAAADTLVSESERRKRPSANEAASSPDNKSLIAEEAAILNVMLQSDGVRLTVEKIMGKVRLSDKTIRKHLTSLRKQKLVEEPDKKKGYSLTNTGRLRARELPADTAADLLNKAVR